MGSHKTTTHNFVDVCLKRGSRTIYILMYMPNESNLFLAVWSEFDHVLMRIQSHLFATIHEFSLSRLVLRGCVCP